MRAQCDGLKVKAVRPNPNILQGPGLEGRTTSYEHALFKDRGSYICLSMLPYVGGFATGQTSEQNFLGSCLRPPDGVVGWAVIIPRESPFGLVPGLLV